MKNQHALVTGATRGIGLAIAEKLLSLGAQVTITGCSPQAPAGLDKFSYLPVDFSSRASTENFCAAVEALPGLSILVNNAGINRIHSITDYPADDFYELTEVNFASVYRVSQAAARAMIAAGTGGRIVNIGSIWATHTRAGRSAYCASKAGVAGMTRGIATDLAPHGILVNTLSPGFVKTELTASTMGPEGIAEVSAQIPVGRLAEPSEIAEVAAFLASPANSYLTGQNITVDGGFTNV